MTVTYTTRKGKHLARPAWLLRPMFFPKKYRVRVSFTKSCEYTLPGEDWQDANKLFGVYGISGERHSFRIGWRWNPNEKCIELCAYRHQDGERFINWFPIKVPLYRDVLISMAFRGDRVFVLVANQIAREYSFRTNWIMFKHNVYFGGNNPAPHDVSLSLNQIK